MAFLTIDDLSNVIYDYALEQITEGDQTITLRAIATAEQEVKSYFYTNNKREYLDGRRKYDVQKIFSKVAQERNSLLVSICCDVARWYIVDLCNADIVYEKAKDRYDRAKETLKLVAEGKITMGDLEEIKQDPTTQSSDVSFFSYGSVTKQGNFY